MILPGFIGPTNPAQSPTVDVARTVNWLPERRDAGNPKSEWWFYATPGLSPFGESSGGVARAAFSQNGRAFEILGSDFCEVLADGTRTIRGSVLPGTSQGTICSNGDGGHQLLVIVGLQGYVFDLEANTLTWIADPDFPQGRAVMASFLDGYFLVLIADSATFQISALEDGTDWDPLDIAQKSQTSDNLTALVVDLDHKVIWLIGSQNTELWWDSGAALFPFEPVPNTLISMGSTAPFSVMLPDDAIVWLGESTNGARMAYEGVGTSAKKISSYAVDAAWSQLTAAEDCIGWTYEYRGHSLCVFTFLTDQQTWVYDRTERQWHEWRYRNPITGQDEAHLARTHMYAFNQHLVGSRVDGTIYTLSGDLLTDAGDPIRRLRRSPHVAQENVWLFNSALQFDFQVGVGLAVTTTTVGYEPHALLRISRDAGRTYGTARQASLGVLGAYTKRVRYLRNGRYRDGVVELTVNDPAVMAMTGAWGTWEAGTS